MFVKCLGSKYGLHTCATLQVKAKRHSYSLNQHSSHDNYYSRLKVKRSASAKEIKSSYYELSKEFHPDKNSSEQAKSAFNAVREAYDTLGDKRERRNYDKFLDSVDLHKTKQTWYNSTSNQPRPDSVHQRMSAAHKAFNDDEKSSHDQMRSWYLRRGRKDPLHPESERYSNFEKKVCDNIDKLKELKWIYMLPLLFVFTLVSYGNS